MPYSDPLCTKCLHPRELHTQVIAKLAQDVGEIKRCTVATCPCIMTFRQDAGKQGEPESSNGQNL